VVPFGQLAASDGRDDEALRRKREEIRDRLRRGEKVVVDKSGAMQVPSSGNNDAIQVPPGKLASSFYWYDNDPELLSAEIELMRRQFPQFDLEKQSDGRMAWIGTISPGMMVSGPRVYTIQVVYEHDHPSTSTYGGSIKVYSIDPNLEEINEIESLPHVLHDDHGHLYLCTHSTEHFRRGDAHASGVSAIAWAVRWFGVFEMWLDGAVPKEDFSSHIY
jgi:hypothetical protein